jgi:hypothetical protein
MDPAAPRSSEQLSRRRLEALMGRLAAAYLDSLNPMERGIALALVRSKGWDLERLASERGPLAGVADRSLAILVSAFALELAAVAPALSYTPAELDAAMGELRAAVR